MSGAIKREYIDFAKKSAAFSAAASAVDFGQGHAFIFDSADTVLSRTLAYLLTASTVCDNACGACKKCGRIFSGKSLDIIDFGDEKIKVEDIDKVTDSCLYMPYELPYKIYILNFTERNDAAQNKLLKTLEEPPERAKFILLTESLQALLPTVRSRCAVYSPKVSESQQIDIYDDDINPNLPYAKYGARGNLTEFDNIMSGKSVENMINAINIIKGLGKSGDMIKLLKYLPSSGTGNRAKLKKTLGYLELILGDIMKAVAGLAVNTFGLYDINTVKNKFDGGGISESLKAVRRAVSRTDSGNLTSVADELIIKLTEVNYNAQSGRN